MKYNFSIFNHNNSVLIYKVSSGIPRRKTPVVHLYHAHARLFRMMFSYLLDTIPDGLQDDWNAYNYQMQVFLCGIVLKHTGRFTNTFLTLNAETL